MAFLWSDSKIGGEGEGSSALYNCVLETFSKLCQNLSLIRRS